MQITRRTDYAIRCVLFVAQRMGEVAMISEIADGMDIPRAFLAKIVQTLSARGIVQSHRGVRGGITLGRDSSEITLYDVVVATEGPIGLNRCALNAHACELSKACVIHPIWAKLRRDMVRALKSHTFADFEQADDTRAPENDRRRAGKLPAGRVGEVPDDSQKGETGVE